MLAEARVGTTGFAYREWVGSVYPRGLAQAELLQLYAQRLAAVEIASTAGRSLSPEQFASWASVVPPGFQFALKAPSRVGQELRLGKPAARAFHGFLEAATELGEHLGPILIQVSEAMKPDRHALAEFLNAVPHGLRLAFELPDPAWHDAATLRLLSAHEAALVLSDAGEEMPRLELTAGFAYVRLRRDDETLDAWAERLALLTRRGVDVYAFLKHDRKGQSLDRAARLSSLLRTETQLGDQHVLS